MSPTDFDNLAKKFYLHIETYKTIDCNNHDLLQYITHEEYWSKIFNLSVDNGKLRDFFNTQSIEDKERYLNFGIACFICFIQTNFTGPDLPEHIQEFLQLDNCKDNHDFANKLSMNGEEINPKTRYPVLLVVAEIIFDCCIVSDLINLWWCCRALMIHQDILDEPSPTLLSNADRLHKLIQTLSIDGHLKAELDIELAQLYLKFSHVSKSKDHITSASKILGVEYELIGKLGRRTKYQENELAQLTVNITLIDKNGIKRPQIDDLNIPKSVNIDDDIRLDHIEFSDGNDIISLPNTEQKLLLTIVQQNLKSRPADELQSEELLPFIEAVINQKSTYAVRVMALLLRCKFESKNRRTITRCLKQCEDIIFSYNNDKLHALNRVGDVFGVSLPPIWKVETQYADILLNIGLVKSSLDIYLKNKLWEEVIVCYTILKLRHKAAEIIRKQLEIKPTVKMMCLLGDATDDESCYEKAWEMSKKRSHRAQRHWAQFLFARKKYDECIPHYEKSLSINPLQSHLWSRLGFAALQTKNWQTAATAYRRYTALEPDSFEAWNNLAQAYINCNNKRSAHFAILEALKCNYENWKVWENLLVISCDIMNFHDVIRAYHHLLDLKEKYLNVDILNVLVYSLYNDTNEQQQNGENSNSNTNILLQKTRELLGRITSIYPGNGAVWELYANLAPTSQLRAQRLQRAYRGYTQIGWDKDPKMCVQVLNICNRLAEIVLDDEIGPSNTIVSSIKLNLMAAVTAATKRNWEETRGVLKEVSNHLEKLIDKIKKGNVVKNDTT